MSIVSMAPCNWAIFCSSVMASTSFSARSRGGRDVSCQAYVVSAKAGSPPVAVAGPANIRGSHQAITADHRCVDRRVRPLGSPGRIVEQRSRRGPSRRRHGDTYRAGHSHRHVDRRSGALERRVLGQAHGHRQRPRQVHRVRRHAGDEGGASPKAERAARSRSLRSTPARPSATRTCARRTSSMPSSSRRSRSSPRASKRSTRTPRACFGNLTMHGITHEIKLEVRDPGHRHRPVGQPARGARGGRQAQAQRLGHEVQPGAGQRQHARRRQGRCLARHLRRPAELSGGTDESS